MLMPSIFGENLFDEMMDSFNDEFFGKRNPLYGKNASRVMKTDIKEVDGRYVIDIDLPGFKKDEIQAQISDGYLTISASKGLDKDQKDDKGRYIRNAIASMALPCLGATRGLGLMIGVEVKGDKTNKELAAKLIENGLLVLTAGPALRFLPPLTITQEDIDQGLAIFQQVLAQ